MKTEKKLKRGLTELSHLFMPVKNGNEEVLSASILVPYFPQLETKTRKLTIAPPEDEICPHRIEQQHLICATMIPVGMTFRMEDQIRLLETLNGTFETSYFLSPVPTREESVIRVHPGKENIRFGFVSDSQFQEALKPKTAVHFEPPGTSKHSLVLFDPSFLNNSSDRIFSFLDHCVFVLPVDYEQFMQAYQLIQYCLTRNPSLRFSIFLNGKGAKANWDFVYERFCDIVSHFLGCDLGFLGWMEGEEIRLNNDLLLDESGGTVQSFAKSRLKILLHQQPSGYS